jgi:hypothetical protein
MFCAANGDCQENVAVIMMNIDEQGYGPGWEKVLGKERR